MDEQKPNVDPVKPGDDAQQINPEPTYVSPSISNAPYAPVSLPTNSLAIVSLVSSILSFVFLWFVGGIIAVVTGIMSRKEIKQSGGAQGGDGMASVGIIVGAINIVFCCLVMVCVGGLIMAGIASEGFR
jgi:hypothetical protein